MEQKAILGGEHTKHYRHRTKVGYHLQKTISISSSSNFLSIQTKLTNLGSEPFTTPWYSHHFFTCDDIPVGNGYSLQLGLKPILEREQNMLYQELALGVWSTPLAEYADVFATSSTNASIEIQMKKEIEEGIRIKAEFPKAVKDYGDASFTLSGCDVSMKEDVPEVQLYQQRPRRQQNHHLSSSKHKNNLNMFAYNVYMEHGTISPEPILLVELEPGESKQWTQRVEFHVGLDEDGDMTNDNVETIKETKEEDFSSSLLQWEEDTVLTPPSLGGGISETNKGENISTNSSLQTFSILIIVLATAVTMWIKRHRWNVASNDRERRRRNYKVIPSMNV